MMIHEVTEKVGSYKPRKRIGRGPGSGHGKTSGRGHKGAGSRSGYSRRIQFEGGQMPYFRRIPKRGFTNAPFKIVCRVVNLGAIVGHPSFAKGGEVTAQTLMKAGLIPSGDAPVKVLSEMGEAKTLKVRLAVSVERVSKKAREMVTGAGGTVTESGTRRDRVRGIDRNNDDQSPKNLTKKLKRGKKKPAAKAAETAADAPAAPAAE